VRDRRDEDFIRQGLPDFPILGFIPYNADVIEADLSGRAVYETSPGTVAAVQGIFNKLNGKA
jgi:CO dehydrogenase maturation factor